MPSDTLIATQEALETALETGGEVYVDGNTTIGLTRPVNVTVPTRIVGGNFTVDSGPAFYVTSSNVTFDSVTITGGGYRQTYDKQQKLIYAQGTKTAPLGNINVTNCRLQGSRGDNVWLEWCQWSRVTNNSIVQYLYSGVMLISGAHVGITGNVICDAPLSSGVVNTYGIAVSDLSNTIEDRSRSVTVTGNHVFYIDWEGIDAHGAADMTITGNTVIACPRSIALVTGNNTRVVSPTQCVVSGNMCDGSGQRRTIREGLWLGGLANQLASGTVVGNRVINHSPNLMFPNVNWSVSVVAANYPAYNGK